MLVQPDLLLRPGSLAAVAPALSERDRAILTATRDALRGAPGDFSTALRALRTAVERLIPAGRTYHLGDDTFGPIIGSLLSGVGIAQGPDGVLIVRARPGAPITRLGRLVP